MKRIAMCLVLAAAQGAEAADQVAEVSDVNQLSLADLLDTQVDVASKKAQTSRETPGIVTVITRDDIVTSGARDLLDVLVLAPGFAPGVDVEGVVDLGIRGQWGHEGKILLLIDGQPMNELLYSTLQLSNHYPLDAIERIEVIRGPGSAIYGGYAELAVINIITRKPEDKIAVATSYGQLGHALGHASATLTFGTSSTAVHGLTATGSLMVGHADGRGTYTDFSGQSYPVQGNAAQDPMFAQLQIAYKQLHVNAIFDDYSMQTRDGTGPVIDAAARQGFRGTYLDAHYDLALAEHVTLTPHFDLIRQSPWQIDDKSSPLYYRKTVTRYTAGVSGSYDPTERIDLLAGVETYSDRAQLDDPTIIGFQTRFGTRNEVGYDTIAGYAQALIHHDLANLTVGARYEHQSAVGGSLVPRVALTKVMGRFHAKLLASQAFRAPGIENINLSTSLVPEKTTVFEGELGYQLTDHLAASVNAFDITIRKPIIYDVDPATGMELYQNFARTGTRGVEADLRLKVPRGHADLNYSFYSARGKNEVTAYAVPDHDAMLLAFPAHKLAVSGSVELYRNLTLAPSAVIYGERYGYIAGDGAGNAMLGRVGPSAQLDGFLLYRDCLIPGLELGAGVYDIANQRVPVLQPYAGGHAPLPGAGRELVARIAYEHGL
ncbi:MAG TPA: TonB-dependent receptor plug domain-containing protein [Kofleriaceae bacterium]|jgi:outer membrane receptor for ferrienterochelin and colicin|nr:TonB-dependent receptor plug domain-containing protein [Kofleriaceae bacterium]